MQRTLVRRLAGVALAGAVGLTGLAAVPAQSNVSPQLPDASAGTLTGWARPGNSQSAKSAAVPEQYQDTAFRQVAAGAGFVLGVTAAGKLVGWGGNQEGAWESKSFPAGLDGQIRQVDASANAGFAVKTDGTVVAWPKTLPSKGLKIPAGLTGVKQVSGQDSFAVALKEDGSVVAWGEDERGQSDVPAELQQPGAAVSVATGTEWAAALTSDQRVVAWGTSNNAATLVPAELTEPGAGVVEIEVAYYTGRARLEDGTVRTWGAGTEHQPGSAPNNRWNDPPAALDGKDVVDIATGGFVYDWTYAVTSDGEVIGWGQQPLPNDNEDPATAPRMPAPPSSLDGKPVSTIVTDSTFAIAVTPAVTTLEDPSVSGTAKVGQTLTGTPARFTGGGEVTHQWLANGTPIEGADGTSLELTDDQLGQTIALRSTATKGDSVVTATSTATSAVVANLRDSSVSATATAGRYGSTAPRVSVTLAPDDASGTVEVWSGSTRLGSATASGGKATVTWASRTALAAGSRALTVRYLGDSRTAPSQRAITVSVAKAAASVTARSATSKIKAKKTKAKVSVQVRATGTTPTGTVSVYLGSAKVGAASLRSGKATVTLKAFKKKGTARLSVRYGGSTNVAAATRTLSVRVR